MFYYPFYTNNFYVSNPAPAYIRMFHASPDTQAVDVYVNNNIIARNLTYRSFTPYILITAGRINIQIFPAGRRDRPVFTENIDIPARSIHTIAIVGRFADLGLLPIFEPIRPIPPGKLFIRFGHLAPNTPNVDLVLSNGTKLFSNVAYKQVTDYMAIDPGTYVFYLRPAGTDRNILYVPNINLRANRFYTIYAIGLEGGTPPLQVVIPLDGNSYIQV
ncbi:MAG: DUF4397 domain-containing protein [Clostridiaceae bacterium]|nr:DUF4397 domain-containing protein [Clostridiaceae bacterium]